MRAHSSYHAATDETVIAVTVNAQEIHFDPGDMAERVRREIARRLADEVMRNVTIHTKDNNSDEVDPTP